MNRWRWLGLLGLFAWFSPVRGQDFERPAPLPWPMLVFQDPDSVWLVPPGWTLRMAPTHSRRSPEFRVLAPGTFRDRQHRPCSCSACPQGATAAPQSHPSRRPIRSKPALATRRTRPNPPQVEEFVVEVQGLPIISGLELCHGVFR